MDLKTRFQAIFDKHRRDYDYMEIRLEQSEENAILMRKSCLENLSVNLESGGNIRVAKNGGWAFVVFNDLADLEEMAESAVKQANLVGRSKCTWASVEPIVDEVRLNHSGDPRKVSLSEKVEIVKKYCHMIDSYGEPIAMSHFRYADKFSTITFANSEGSYIVQEKCDLTGLILVYASRDGMTETDMIGFGSTDDFGVIYGLEDEILQSCKTAAALLDAPRLKGGQYTVILDPDMTGLFTHEAFGHLSEADGLADNAALQETMKLGRIFGQPHLNIYDAPLDRRRGTSKYDDEGVPAEKVYLVKQGELVGRLHSRETAGGMGELPTGNARAISYKYPPIVRMRSTAIEGGEHTFEDLLRDIKEGVYMVKAQGGKTTGENFSFTSGYGYRIQDGQLTEMVKGVTLAGNVFTTLKNIDMVANDEITPNFPWGCGKSGQMGCPVTQGGPHIRIQNVTIGGEE